MIRRNVIANYAGTAWTMAIGIIFLPLYVRLLGVEAFGLIGVFTLLQAWLLLLDAGITPAVTRETSKLVSASDHPELWRVLRTSEGLAGVAGSLAFCAVAIVAFFMADTWLDTTLPATTVIHAFLLMGGVIALRFVENVYRAALVGLEHQVTLNVLTAILSTLRAGGAVLVLVFVSRSVWGFFLWQTGVSLLTVAIFAIVLYRRLPGDSARAQFSRSTLKRIWRFSIGTFLITLLGTFLSQTDKVVLSAMIPLQEFGYYAFAATVAGYVRSFVQPIYQAVFPRLVALSQSRNGQATALLYHQSCQLSMMLMGSAAVWLIMFGEVVLSLWTQNADFAARVSPLLAILLLGFTLNGALNGPYHLQLAEGWTSLLVRTNAIMALILAPAIWLAVKSFGMFGGAAAWAAVNLIYLVLVVQIMHRRILPTEKSRWYVDDTLFPLAAAAAAAMLCRLLFGTPESLPLKLLVLAASGLICVTMAGFAAPEARRLLFALLRPHRYG